jgi:hypothetical protein
MALSQVPVVKLISGQERKSALLTIESFISFHL